MKLYFTALMRYTALLLIPGSGSHQTRFRTKFCSFWPFFKFTTCTRYAVIKLSVHYATTSEHKGLTATLIQSNAYISGMSQRQLLWVIQHPQGDIITANTHYELLSPPLSCCANWYPFPMTCSGIFSLTCTSRSLWQTWRHCVPLELRLLWRQQSRVCESGGDEGSGDETAGIAEWQRALIGNRNCDWHGKSGRRHCGLRKHR